MTRLPRISGRECLKALQKAGFTLRRRYGSHFTLHREELSAHLLVPHHQELDRGSMRAVIRQSGLNPAEFLNLLQGYSHRRKAGAWHRTPDTRLTPPNR